MGRWRTERSESLAETIMLTDAFAANYCTIKQASVEGLVRGLDARDDSIGACCGGCHAPLPDCERGFGERDSKLTSRKFEREAGPAALPIGFGGVLAAFHGDGVNAPLAGGEVGNR
jgi:hypothetical protein